MTTEQQAKQVAIRRIICPICDGAVRPVDVTPCPNCRGCPSCGRKLGRGQTRCGCAFSENPERVAKLLQLFGVTDEQAEIAARRFEIHKRRERKSLVSTLILLGVFLIVSQLLRNYLDPQSFTDYAIYLLGIMVVCGPCAFVLNRWQKGSESRLMQKEPKGSEH
jgi:hypothetical protein